MTLMKGQTTKHLFFILILLLLPICFEFNASAEEQENCKSEILITIERGACFGSCPIYSAQIYADGTVIYKGKDFVKVTGERKYRISTDKLRELVKAFEQINYFSLKDRYETDENGRSITDQPTTTTSICLRGQRKQVVDYYYAPKELVDLENEIERIAGLNEFIGPL